MIHLQWRHSVYGTSLWQKRWSASAIKFNVIMRTSKWVVKCSASFVQLNFSSPYVVAFLLISIHSKKKYFIFVLSRQVLLTRIKTDKWTRLKDRGQRWELQPHNDGLRYFFFNAQHWWIKLVFFLPFTSFRDAEVTAKDHSCDLLLRNLAYLKVNTSKNPL